MFGNNGPGKGMRMKNIIIPAMLLVFLAAAAPAGAISLTVPGEVSQYVPATITSQEIRKEIEKRLKERIDKELSRVTGEALGEADISTYIEIIDHCANGEVDKAKDLAGEQVAGMLLKAVVGNGASVITWAWSFAKGSYNQVQAWAKDQSRQYFIKNFLLPRVDKWRRGEGFFADTHQLSRQFNEWFEFPENYAEITATQPWLSRKKWVDQLKNEMWAKTLDLAVRYRKYHNQLKTLQARARAKKRAYYYFATRQYQQLLKDAAADKVSVTEYLRDKKTKPIPPGADKKQPLPAKTPAVKKAVKKKDNQGKEPGGDNPRKGLSEDERLQLDRYNQMLAWIAGLQRPMTGTEKSRFDDLEKKARVIEKKQGPSPGVRQQPAKKPQLRPAQPGCVNIKPAQRISRLQKMVHRELVAELEKYRKKNALQLADFRSANIGIYNGTTDWEYYASLARPYLYVPPESPRIPTGDWVDDPICPAQINLPYDEAIKSVFRQRYALYRTWYKEVAPAYASAVERRNQAIAKLKKLRQELRDAVLEVEKDAIPDFNDLSPQQRYYTGQDSLYFPKTLDQRAVASYAITLFDYAHRNYAAGIRANNAAALNRAAAAIREVENEASRLLEYGAKKKKQWEEIDRHDSLDVDILLDRSGELINETMNLVGAGSREVAAVMDHMHLLQGLIQKNQDQLDRYRSSLDQLAADFQSHLRKFSRFKEEIDARFANNRIYDKASETAKQLLPLLDRYWHVYQLKKSLEYAVNLKSINISYTMKSPLELLNEWRNGGLLQPVLVNRMAEIAKQEWYKELTALKKNDVTKFISAFQKGEKFLNKYKEKKIRYRENSWIAVLPAEEYYLPVLFTEVKNKVEAYLLPFSKKYADSASGVVPLKNYLPNLYEEFTRFNKQMVEIRKQWPTLFGLAPNRVREAPGPQPPDRTEENRYITRQMIEALYSEFARQYSDRNLAGVLHLLASDWSSPDGSDLTDIEDTLANTFDTFDRIEYRISGLENAPLHHTTEVSVSYTATVKGYLFDQDLVHKESFTVNEIVAIQEGGLKIKKTLSGGFW